MSKSKDDNLIYDINIKLVALAFDTYRVVQKKGKPINQIN